ncbi:RluA family pseudouridine synthase [Bacillus solitudinis]|uniref:RluA family pseudouridine synthase n=1 Tax=Bacillus solitudinis TaxID=2014074 RepID=UPI000C24C274|nr:RluA family pseudouridine synthase [Bacillus solitudinis]
MTSYEWTVNSEQKQERLDKFLTQLEEDWSRTQVQIWIKEGHVLVNDKQPKSNYKVEEGDIVILNIPEPETLEVEPENIPLDIVYEDEDVIVVNKPRGMVVHPAPGHYSGTLVNALMYHCKDLSGINGIIRPGIVHRIDMDTSGLLMVAKNDKAHESLVNQLKAKTTKRLYKAIVHGVIPHQHGTVDAPIGRDKKDRQSMTVTDGNSRDAVTHFTVIECFEKYTYVQCELETGRTHQIRVHMKYIGYPLAGDPKYGPKKKTLDINGQALHASVLGFKHPRTDKFLEFEAPLPEDMKILLDHLRK